jgi:hypothetical protein
VAGNGGERALGHAVSDANPPVHLHGLSRREVKCQECLAMSVWAKTPQTAAQDRDAAFGPQGPQSLEHGGRGHLGPVVENLADRGLVRVEDRGSRLGGRALRAGY